MGRNVLMLLEENELYGLIDWLRSPRESQLAAPGLLIVTRDPNRIQQQDVGPVRASHTTDALNFSYRRDMSIEGLIGGQSLQRMMPVPTCYITAETANRLLATQGLSVADLRQRLEGMAWDTINDTGEAFIIEPLPVSVTISVQVAPIRTVTATNVIGFFPGTDTELDKELVVVGAHYDGLPLPPDGAALAPGAVDSAASVATMLEIVRLGREQDFQPRRTVMFVALAGGESSLKTVEQLISQHTVFKTLQPVAFIQLDNMVGGPSGRLLISDDDFRLYSLASQSAAKMGLGAELVHLELTIPRYNSSAVQVPGQYTNRSGPVHRYFTLPLQQAQVPSVALRWEGSDAVIHRPADVASALDADAITRTGRAIDLLLRVLARETTY